MNAASDQLQVLFITLGLVLGGLFIAGIGYAWRNTGATGIDTLRAVLRAQFGTVAWLGATFGLAAAGRLTFDSMPPTMMVMIVLTFIIIFRIGRSSAGDRLARGLPLAILVGVHAFRLPLEVMMHRAYTEGIMPVQMSYSGYNFDIVTGVAAIIVAGLVATGKAGTNLVRAWNWLAVLLLANILTIAILSTPTPFRVFDNEPANTWITHAPYVWLPTVMVAFAVLGHIVLFRRLRIAESATPPAMAGTRA